MTALQHTASNRGGLQRQNYGIQYTTIQYRVHVELYNLSRLLKIVLENWTCQVY